MKHPAYYSTFESGRFEVQGMKGEEAMVKWLKVLLSVLIVVSLSTTLFTGCQNSTGSGNSDSNTTITENTGSPNSAAGSESSTAAVQDDPFGKYPEPVTIQMVGSTNQADAWKWDALKSIGETFEDNRWTRLFKDELNINVQYNWVVDSTQYDQKFKMMIASGELPDVTKVQLIDLNQLTEADLITDMGPYFDKYASKLTKEFTNMDGGLINSAISVDGKMMGIPQPTASIGNNQYLWLRTDWMKKLNLDAPKTMDELVALMEAFVKNDPDGNNKDDTFSMLVSKPTEAELWGMWQTLTGYFWCFDAYPTTWIKGADGTLQYGSTLPNMKNALRVLQNMYKSGWLDPEFIVKDFDKAKEIVVAGKCGVEFGYHWTPMISLKPNKDNDSNAEWGAFEMPSATGGTVKSKTDLGLRSTLVVKKGFEHPEAIIKMMNLYNEKLFGENADYDYYAQPKINDKLVNEIWYFGPLDSLYDQIDVAPIKAIQPALEGKTSPDTLKGTAKTFYDNVMKDWSWDKMFGKGENSAGYFMTRAVDDPEKYIVPNLFVGAPTATMVERWSQIQELRDTVVTKIIVGELDVDSGFDNFVADWNKAGGDKITAEVNEWYKVNALKK